MTQANVRYEVQPTNPKVARDDLLRVWKNLDVIGDVADKFRWTYELAPHSPDTVFLLKANDRVVGSAGYGIRDFRVHGENKRFAVLADLAVDAEHRSLSPALSLVKAAREFVHTEFDFGYGWPNNKAEGVFTRARFKSLGRLQRYVRVLRYEAYLDRVHYFTERLKQLPHLPAGVASLLTKRPVALVGTRVLSQVQRARHVAKTLPNVSAHTLEWTTPTDERIDAIWQVAQAKYPIVAERTSRVLSWRFANDNVRVALLTRKHDRAPVAYAIVRIVRGDAQIVDIFGEPDALRPLIALLVRAMWHEPGVHAVSCTYVGQSRFVETLFQSGFEKKQDKCNSVFICSGKIDSQSAPEFEAAENWHLTAFDEDI